LDDEQLNRALYALGLRLVRRIVVDGEDFESAVASAVDEARSMSGRPLPVSRDDVAYALGAVLSSIFDAVTGATGMQPVQFLDLMDGASERHASLSRIDALIDEVEGRQQP
jgi:hypothetical protein